MDRGRRVAAKALLSWRRAQDEGMDQVPAIALHGQWIQAACDKAVQCFWQELAAFVHFLNACDPGKGPALGAVHPFVGSAGVDPDTGSFVYELPVAGGGSDSTSSSSLPRL